MHSHAFETWGTCLTDTQSTHFSVLVFIVYGMEEHQLHLGFQLVFNRKTCDTSYVQFVLNQKAFIQPFFKLYEVEKPCIQPIFNLY